MTGKDRQERENILFQDTPLPEKEQRRIVEWDKTAVWHPFTQMKDWVEEEPLVIHHGRDNYLYDTAGNKYLDGISSLWVNVLGHQPERIREYIHRQMDQVMHTTFLGQSNVPAAMLAARLVEVTPERLSRVFYSDNGSTAAEIAIKMCYQARLQQGQGHRGKFITFRGAYHGDSLGAVSVGGIDLFHGKYKPLLFDSHQIPFPHCYRCPWKKEPTECSRDKAAPCFQEAKKIIEQKASESTAVICEPLVQGADGIKTMPPGYLKHVETCARNNDLYLICDEVATGFGKTGTLLAVEQEEVQPDVLTLAKGITGGVLPLAATLTSENIYQAFYDQYETYKTFFHGHSFTGNQLGAVAALAVMEELVGDHPVSQGPFWEDLRSRLEEYGRLLEEYVAPLPWVGEIRRRGVMTGVEIVADRKSKEPHPPAAKIPQKIVEAARARGLLIRPLGNVMVLMPSLVFSPAELETLVKTTAEAVSYVLSDG